MQSAALCFQALTYQLRQSAGETCCQGHLDKSQLVCSYPTRADACAAVVTAWHVTPVIQIRSLPTCDDNALLVAVWCEVLPTVFRPVVQQTEAPQVSLRVERRRCAQPRNQGRYRPTFSGSSFKPRCLLPVRQFHLLLLAGSQENDELRLARGQRSEARAFTTLRSLLPLKIED